MAECSGESGSLNAAALSRVSKFREHALGLVGLVDAAEGGSGEGCHTQATRTRTHMHMHRHMHRDMHMHMHMHMHTGMHMHMHMPPRSESGHVV